MGYTFGRRGADLLKEIVNHDKLSLSAYNVCATPFMIVHTALHHLLVLTVCPVCRRTKSGLC